jgi:hypothetical protein
MSLFFSPNQQCNCKDILNVIFPNIFHNYTFFVCLKKTPCLNIFLFTLKMHLYLYKQTTSYIKPFLASFKQVCFSHSYRSMMFIYNLSVSFLQHCRSLFLSLQEMEDSYSIFNIGIIGLNFSNLCGCLKV